MCEHHHHHNETNNKKEAAVIIAAAAVFTVAFLMQSTGTGRFLIFLAAYLIAGGEILWKAVKNILRGEIFDENFLMGVATLGAMAIGEYPEAVMVMILYRIGEYFQGLAVKKSRKSITDLMDIRPEHANVEENGIIITKSPEKVKINDIIIVKAGEKIPLDGEIIEGKAILDTSALTGESIPREAQKGDTVLSGCINTNGLIKIRVTKEFTDSTVSKILELVEHASSKKAKAENFITKFAHYYTPVVVFGALLLATIPPVLTGTAFNIWIERALTFLVISCPCALVISVPLSFFAGIGGASKCGILIKGSSYLELLSKPDSVVFDKTGTLTKGSFKVTKINPQDGITREELLELTAAAENFSNHPIAISIKNAYGKEINPTAITDVVEDAGNGVSANINGIRVLAGNTKLMEKYNINFKQSNESGTIIYTAKNNEFIGYIVISDEIKPDSTDAVKELKKLVNNIVMLTGDSENTARHIAAKLGIEKYYSELLPADKVAKIEEIIQAKAKNKSVIFTGDGINDAPVLARADIGIAMGGLGSDAAIEASDVVIMDDKPSKIPAAVKIAQKTMLIVRQNIIFAIGVKVLFLMLGAFGHMTMWGAVFADVGVTLLAVLNSLRALKSPQI